MRQINEDALEKQFLADLDDADLAGLLKGGSSSQPTQEKAWGRSLFQGAFQSAKSTPSNSASINPTDSRRQARTDLSDQSPDRDGCNTVESDNPPASTDSMESNNRHNELDLFAAIESAVNRTGSTQSGAAKVDLHEDLNHWEALLESEGLGEIGEPPKPTKAGRKKDSHYKPIDGYEDPFESEPDGLTEPVDFFARTSASRQARLDGGRTSIRVRQNDAVTSLATQQLRHHHQVYFNDFFENQVEKMVAFWTATSQLKNLGLGGLSLNTLSTLMLIAYREVSQQKRSSVQCICELTGMSLPAALDCLSQLGWLPERAVASDSFNEGLNSRPGAHKDLGSEATTHGGPLDDDTNDNINRDPDDQFNGDLARYIEQQSRIETDVSKQDPIQGKGQIASPPIDLLIEARPIQSFSEDFPHFEFSLTDLAKSVFERAFDR